MTDDIDPFDPKGLRKQIKLAVVVTGYDETRKATRQTVGRAATLSAAFRTFTGVINQWAASEGAIREGTTVSITDMRDGGTIVKAEFLGFSETLFPGGN